MESNGLASKLPAEPVGPQPKQFGGACGEGIACFLDQKKDSIVDSLHLPQPATHDCTNENCPAIYKMGI